MAENFETLENILPDLANKEIEITLVEAVYKFQKEEEEKTFLRGEWLGINSGAISAARDKTKQNGSKNYFKVTNNFFASHLSNTKSRNLKKLIY